MSAQLSAVELVRVSTVLRATADQLTVLGHTMSGVGSVVEVDIGEITEQHRAGEQQLGTVHEGQAGLGDFSEAMQELHWSHQELKDILERSPLPRDNLAKAQRDRHFISKVITNVLAELQEKYTFHSLLQEVEQEEQRKVHLQDIITREEEGRLRIKMLQKQLVDVRKEKTLELQRREEMTAHLKDQLQEMKVKTSLEKKHVTSSAELQVYQGQKHNTQKEKELEEKIREKLEEETRVHVEMESFLKEQQTNLGEKLEYWMERYEKDTEDKQQELNTLKINKTNNMAQLQDLAKKYRESEHVIIEDRVAKENLRKRLEKEQLERDSAIKIQSWWRGTLIRKSLGSYKKGKKPKAKEGKKGKRKKK